MFMWKLSKIHDIDSEEVYLSTSNHCWYIYSDKLTYRNLNCDWLTVTYSLRNVSSEQSVNHTWITS